MTVSEFIIVFDIEALNNQQIMHNDKIYRIVLSDQDKEFHSLSHITWDGSKKAFDDYHCKAHYRFYAVNEKNKAIWVYPNTDIYIAVDFFVDNDDKNVFITKYGAIAVVEEWGIKKMDGKKCRFNSANDLLAFLNDKELTENIFGY